MKEGEEGRGEGRAKGEPKLGSDVISSKKRREEEEMAEGVAKF